LPDTNARQIAQTIRMPSTALLTIDSEDRYKDYPSGRAIPTSPYNFAISKSESLMPGFMTRIGISEVVFPWTIPNINNKTNSINLTVFTGAGSSTVKLVLPNGFYPPFAIASQLQDLVQGRLTALGLADTFVLEYGVTLMPQFTYTLTTAVGTTLTFSAIPYNTPAYPYPPGSKQLFDVLGFFGVGGSTPENTTFTGQFTLCQAIRYVDIVCNQLTNSQAQKDQTSQPVVRDMLCRIYLGDLGQSGSYGSLVSEEGFTPPGCTPGVIYRNFATPKQIQWIPNQNIPGFLQFQVYDDAGQLLDTSLATTDQVNDGYLFSDWSMTMQVSEC
jgi:hypothetical protein